MTIKEFFSERDRMFKKYGLDYKGSRGICYCNGICSICRDKISSKDFCMLTLEEQIEVISNFTDNNKIMTNAQKYKEVFGCEVGGTNGWKPCPPHSAPDCNGVKCSTCKKWWDEEYEERQEDEQ